MARSWAAPMMPSSGGSQSVTFDAPMMASSFVRGPSDSAAVTWSTVKVPAVEHSTNRRRQSGAQGSRLAWCSATVVTITSSASRRRR